MEKEYNFRSITVYLKARLLVKKAEYYKNRCLRGSEIEETLTKRITELNKDIEKFEEYYLDVLDVKVILQNSAIDYEVVNGEVLIKAQK